MTSTNVDSETRDALGDVEVLKPDQTMSIDGAPAPSPPAPSDASGAWLSPSPRTRRLEVLIVAVVFAVRFGLGVHRNAPRFFPDEFAAFGMARWLSGTGSWQMFDLDTYRPGFPVLIAPLYWLTNDSFVILHAALALQSVIAAASVIVLAQLVRRFTSMSPVGAMLTSAGIALAPASAGASAAVWSEPSVTLAYLLTLRGLLQFFDTRRLSAGVAAVVWAVIGATAHSRLLSLPIVVAMIIGWHLVRCGRRRATLGVLLCMVVSVAVSGRFSSIVVSNVWDDPGDAHTVFGVLARFGNPVRVLDSVIGQTWYQLAATLGLAGIGAVAVIAASSGRSIGGAASLRARDARLLLATLVPLLGVSALFMSGRDRVDHAVYGRYNDAVLWPVIALGVAWAVGQARKGFGSIDRRDARLLLGSSGALLATALYIHLRQLVPEGAALVPDMVAGVIWMSPTDNLVDVLPITLVALVLMGFTMATIRNQVKHRPLLVLVIGLVFVAEVAQVRALNGGDGFARYANFQDLAGDPLEADEVVGFKFTPGNPVVTTRIQREAAQLVQWYLPEIRLVRSSGDEAGVPYVFAAINDGDLRSAGAEVVWLDDRTLIALFRKDLDGEGS